MPRGRCMIRKYRSAKCSPPTLSGDDIDVLWHVNGPAPPGWQSRVWFWDKKDRQWPSIPDSDLPTNVSHSLNRQCSRYLISKMQVHFTVILHNVCQRGSTVEVASVRNVSSDEGRAYDIESHTSLPQVNLGQPPRVLVVGHAPGWNYVIPLVNMDGYPAQFWGRRSAGQLQLC